MEAAVAGTDSAADIERGVARRLARQAILRRENPPRYHAILDESVLLRTVAGRPVMRDQMRRLADAATEPHMKIQLMLLDRGVSPGANGVFGIISLPAPTPDVVHGESAAAGHDDCIEVAALPSGEVGLRDSKHPEVGHLVFTRSEIAAFVAGAKAGEFDDLCRG